MIRMKKMVEKEFTFCDIEGCEEEISGYYSCVICGKVYCKEHLERYTSEYEEGLWAANTAYICHVCWTKPPNKLDDIQRLKLGGFRRIKDFKEWVNLKQEEIQSNRGKLEHGLKELNDEIGKRVFLI